MENGIAWVFRSCGVIALNKLTADQIPGCTRDALDPIERIWHSGFPAWPRSDIILRNGIPAGADKIDAIPLIAADDIGRMKSNLDSGLIAEGVEIR